MKFHNQLFTLFLLFPQYARIIKNMYACCILITTAMKSIMRQITLTKICQLAVTNDEIFKTTKSR